jgi:hypothetical protein
VVAVSLCRQKLQQVLTRHLSIPEGTLTCTASSRQFPLGDSCALGACSDVLEEWALSVGLLMETHRKCTNAGRCAPKSAVLMASLVCQGGHLRLLAKAWAVGWKISTLWGSMCFRVKSKVVLLIVNQAVSTLQFKLQWHKQYGSLTSRFYKWVWCFKSAFHN